MSVNPDIIDLTTETQDIEITRPQVSPHKINNLKKQKRKCLFLALFQLTTCLKLR